MRVDEFLVGFWVDITGLSPLPSVLPQIDLLLLLLYVRNNTVVPVRHQSYYTKTLVFHHERKIFGDPSLVPSLSLKRLGSWTHFPDLVGDVGMAGFSCRVAGR